MFKTSSSLTTIKSKEDNNSMGDSQIITTKELADILQISQRRIAELAKNGTLPAMKNCHGRFSVTALRKRLPKFYCGHSFVQPALFCYNWVSPVQAAKIMKCSRATILRWTRQKKVRYFKFGQHTIRFRVEHLVE